MEEKQSVKGICGSTLKIMAMVIMLIDHIGAAVLGRIFVAGHVTLELYYVYMALRFIGRLAFPIYCYMLVEGFYKTRNVSKYAIRLGLFALISEIPFDLAFRGQVIAWDYQNVFFTLTIGLVCMQLLAKIESTGLRSFLKVLLRLVVVAAGAGLAELMCTDYGAIGVLCILVLYVFYHNKKRQTLAGCLVFAWELTAPLAFIPLAFYNGRKGLKLKYFFYAFYPAHLLILYFVCFLMGISHYPAY